jgi:hypothetical protein
LLRAEFLERLAGWLLFLGFAALLVAAALDSADVYDVI